METNQLLQALSDMMDQKLDEKLDQKLDQKLDEKLDEKLQPIYTRLDRVENRLNVVEVKQDRTIKKLNDFQLDVKIAERDITNSIHKLQDEMETVIEVLKMNELVPR